MAPIFHEIRYVLILQVVQATGPYKGHSILSMKDIAMRYPLIAFFLPQVLQLWGIETDIHEVPDRMEGLPLSAW
jgi:hypothetical protein